MKKRDKEIVKLVEANGFILKRDNNHFVFIHKLCRQIFVVAKSTSSRNTNKRVISGIKKYFKNNDLGIPVV